MPRPRRRLQLRRIAPQIMPLALSVTSSGDLAGDIRAMVPALKRAHSQTVAKVGAGLKQQLRADLVAAGIKKGASRGRGQDLSNSWRDRYYPKSGEDSLNPAVYVKSSAERIIAWLAEGPTVRAANGSYVMVPLPDAIARGLDRMLRVRLEGGGLRFGKYADFGGLQSLFGGKLKTIPLRRGGYLLAVATGDYGAAGYKAKRATRAAKTGLVPLFLLLRQVQGRKRIDPEATARRFYDLLPTILEAELARVGLAGEGA
jgi:hypothetical protein